MNREVCTEYILIQEELVDIMIKSLGCAHFVDLRTKVIIINRDMSLSEDFRNCDIMECELCNIVYQD